MDTVTKHRISGRFLDRLRYGNSGVLGRKLNRHLPLGLIARRSNGGFLDCGEARLSLLRRLSLPFESVVQGAHPPGAHFHVEHKLKLTPRTRVPPNIGWRTTFGCAWGSE